MSYLFLSLPLMNNVSKVLGGRKLVSKLRYSFFWWYVKKAYQKPSPDKILKIKNNFFTESEKLNYTTYTTYTFLLFYYTLYIIFNNNILYIGIDSKE